MYLTKRRLEQILVAPTGIETVTYEFIVICTINFLHMTFSFIFTFASSPPQHEAEASMRLPMVPLILIL